VADWIHRQAQKASQEQMLKATQGRQIVLAS
jgi:hypothetical protein